MHKIKNTPLQPSTIFSCLGQMSQSACLSSKIVCVVMFGWGTTAMSKARGWPQGWQMPDPRGVQNLLMLDPLD